MPAVPAKLTFEYVVQDNRGFKARVNIHGFTADISTDAALISDLFTVTAALGTAVANATNGKVVSTGFAFDFDIAQEPSTETGTYQLVQDKAILTFGDGTVLKEQVYIPAPRDSLFFTTTQDNLIVVNPASSIVTGLQSAVSSQPSPAGGIILSQFFGGQYKGSKSRRRRVRQGA